MITTMKCLNSSGESNLTTNQDYIVLGFLSAGTGVIIDDNGDTYLNSNDFRDGSKWQLLSVTDIGSVQLFP